MRFILLLFIFLTTATHFPANAQSGNVQISGELKKWHPVTLSITGPQATETQNNPNPFLDYRFQIIFTRPNGTSITIPGYFAGDGSGGTSGNIWRAHLNPDMSGTWQYRTSFRSGTNIAVDTAAAPGSSVAAYDNISGSMTIGALDQSAPGFLKWGLLEYVGKHHLKFRDGSYWIKGGADSPENVLGLAFAPHGGLHGALYYLGDKNVNSIYFLPMNLGGDAKDTYPHPSATDKTHYDNSKLDSWNLAFNVAQRRGIHLHFVLAEAEAGNKNYYDGGGFGIQRKLYFRELVARFGHHNALQWNISEEFNASFAMAWDPALVKQMAAYLKQIDPYKHPVTVHNASSINELDTFMGDPNFDLSSYQQIDATTNNGRDVESKRALSASRGRPWVISFDEIRTLTATNAVAQRKEITWPVYLSGGQLEWYVKGADQSLQDFRPYADHWDYTWYARKFMEEIPFWDMVPADASLTSPTNGQMLAKAGEIYALYTPSKTTVSVTIPLGNYQVRWYDPGTGLFLSTVTTNSGQGISLGTSPCSDDCAAIISKTGTITPTITPVPPISNAPTITITTPPVSPPPTTCTITVVSGQSISSAISTLTAGQTLCVASGTYHEQIVVQSKNGSASQPITIRAADFANPPVIDGRAGRTSGNTGLPSGALGGTDPQSGKGFVWAGLVHVRNSSYIVMNGFVITNSMGTGVLTESSHHITYDNLDVNYSRHAAYRYYASTDGILQNSRIWRNANFATYSRSASTLNWPVIVNSTGGSDRHLYKKLVIFENWGEGIDAGPNALVEDSVFYDNYALQIYSNGHTGTSIERNFIYCSNPTFYRGGSPSAGIVLNKEINSGGTGSGNITVFNNIVTGCGSGISLWAQAGLGLTDGLFAHNTLVNTSGSAISISNAPHQNVRFINNIVHNQQGIATGSTAGISYANNIWFGSAGPTGNNNRQIDPQLANPTASNQSENYKLKSTSPAIDSASATSATTDYFGTVRPQGSVADVGAHEFSIASISPTPVIPICPAKKSGDADCRADGVGKQITLVDFQIWRNEFFAGCSSTNLTGTGCQTDEDNDGSIIDANFDTDTTVSMADFEIWRKGYFM